MLTNPASWGQLCLHGWHATKLSVSLVNGYFRGSDNIMGFLQLHTPSLTSLEQCGTVSERGMSAGQAVLHGETSHCSIGSYKVLVSPS